jgi:molybdate transport system regulatory protein
MDAQLKSSISPFRLRLRIAVGSEIVLGPGKADLLQGIQETGSIAAAGRRMSMSYKRAWYLVDAMNGQFTEPLVEASKGGRAGGGAKLTALGEHVLSTFRAMEAKTQRVIAPDLRRLRRMLGRRLTSAHH